MSWGNQMYNAESVGALRPGIYVATIAKVEMQDYEGSRYVNVQFKAPEGSAFEKFYTEHSNPKAVSTGYGKMKQLAIACGWVADDERKTMTKNGMEFESPAQLKGLQVCITVAENEHNGKTYTNVTGYEPATFGSAGGQPYSTKADDISGGSEPFRGQF